MIPVTNSCLDLRAWTTEHYMFFFNYISTLQSKGFDSIPQLYKNRYVGLIFQEPSTRTRISFEKALTHLGATPIVVEEHSSLKKGETLWDTVQTLRAMDIRDFVIRSSTDEIFSIANQYQDGFLINAGSGASNHPTQGLLDAYTVWTHIKKIQGKKVVLVGDLAHSRVARSNLSWLKTLGAHVIATGPKEWIHDFDQDVEVVESFDHAIKGADVIMLHRVQKERFASDEIFDVETYAKQYGLSEEKMGVVEKHALIMHPGPFNRGIEISDAVVSHKQSKIFEQVHNGLWVRIGLLQLLKSGGMGV